MKRSLLKIAAAVLLLAACGSPAAAPTALPTTAPTATPIATATAQPTAAPTITMAPTAEVTPTTAQVEQKNFAPKVRSVWNTAVGLDEMKGTCAKGSMLPVYGLVQITPDGETINWKSQEPAPYVMTRLQVNQYQYAGPTALKDGVVTMTLKFIGEQALEMLREFVSQADPACLHTHVYTGTFQWEKP